MRTEEKRELRQRVRVLRCSLDPAFCTAAASDVAESLLALPELRSSRVVLGYVATEEELDPAAALEALHGLGKIVALSRIEAPGQLGLHVFEHARGLETGPFGIMQPPVSAPRVPEASIDAVIVPGVAFDADGGRVGYGGGYYDRLLPRLRPDAFRIGIAYDEQIVEELPAEDHDERMDAIVTPTRVFITPPRPERIPGSHPSEE